MVGVNANKRTPRKRVRRTSTSTLLSKGASQHLWNCLAVTIIGSITVAFLLLQRHEERAHGIGLGSSSSAVALHPIKRRLEENKPFLIYGTAWKEDKTAELVEHAIEVGFRFIDTAAQPKHYNEALVGEGWTNAAKKLKLKREEIFLQTKYSPYQDNNPPYDVNDPVDEQVKQSLQSSLNNLKTKYIDSLVLHSPLHTMEDTLLVWKTMESFVDDGFVLHLGISNCYDIDKFKTLYEAARHKPFALQNRFYEKSNFDTELRQFCKEHHVRYQSFWTLTANSKALKQPDIHDMAEQRGLTPQTLLYAFLMSLEYVTPLSGTTSLKHMEQDVAVMQRIEGGEVLFETEDDLRQMAKALGMPDL